MILNTLYVFYIYMYNTNNVHLFSIFYNIYTFSFLSLCVRGGPFDTQGGGALYIFETNYLAFNY